MPIGQVLRFLAVAGAALAAAIPAVRAQDIVTTGNCSPVITNISGAVNVNVTCIDADSNKPKFRVTYYRVGGLALSFLLDGLLTPEWAERLGGQQAIVRNAVSEEARTFLDQFATPIEGSSLFGDIGLKDGEYYGSLADYAKSVDPAVKFRDGNEGQFPDLDPKRWRAYYGGGRVDQIFVPDIEAARILFETPGWPENYGMLYGGTDGEYPPTVEDGKMMPAPLLWRWLTQADLDGFEDGYERYVRAVLEKIVPTAGGTPIDVGGNETVDEILASRMSGDLYDGIDSIRYLAREGLPDNFMLVRGWIGQHYGWAFTSTPRDFQLLIAVFENVSDGPIELGDFTLRQIDAMTLRQNAETDAELATSLPERKRVYPPGVLKPKEKVVVPVRIELPQAEVYNDPARDLRGSARAGRRVL
ncbi:MAG: hypothetical protein KDJ77_08155, partial [Rhodobiaceae bacterium]|nr:hypothetical protein [Rhodobiaceae bacterium]